MYDAIIIGAGPAGLEAALFCARAGLKTIVAGNPEKSDLAFGRKIGNLFGISGEPPGYVLLANSVTAAKKYGADFIIDEVVDVRKKDGGTFAVKFASDATQDSKTLIIATGAAHQKAGIENEDTYLGKGVHTCVACDGFFYKGKTVGVVGEGNFAAEEALELLAFTDKVTVFSQGKEWAMSPEIKKSLEDKKVTLKKDRIIKISGEPNVQEAEREDGTKFPLDGIFVALGTTSSIAFAQKLGLVLEDRRYIEIDRDGRASLEGVYAAGGCTGGNQQIAKSVGEGANAAIAIIKRLRGVAQYFDQT